MFHQAKNSIGNYNYNIYVYENTSYQLHFHKNYELIFIINGNLSVKLYEHNLIMQKGDLLLISPNVPHGFTPCDSSIIWVCVFSDDHIPVFSKKYSETIFSEFKCDTLHEKFLYENLFSKKKIDIYERISLFYTVCSQLLKNAHIIHIQSRSFTDLAYILQKTVYENFSDNLTLKDIANKLGYDYHYLSKVFNNCFAMNFSRFVNMCRFSKSCELLETTDKSLTQIAMSCGFGSIRNFNRVFKSMCGQTPNEYRAKHSY